MILDHHPRFALIAGGRPDQALELEKAGIATFLHVPSPGLLKLFLESGTKRFIFEGHECGGHVGPRASSILWQQAVDVLLDHFPPGKPMDVELLFAGGVHDAMSAAMVAALGARLAARGAKIGVLIGTGYLFTHEAVAAGAIRQSYQDLVLKAEDTVLLESGPGHMTRVADSPIVAEFRAEKARLQREGLSGADIRDELEHFNIGRSRIASKGIDRNPAHAADASAPRFVDVSAEDQLRLGVYMTGQAAGLHDKPVSIAELHDDVSAGSVALLETFAAPEAAQAEAAPEGRGARIAITGMGTILPHATDARAYWQNILDKVDAIEEVPARRWDWRRYYDEDRNAPDKIYSKWGGFVDEIEFDPLRYGIPPNSVPQIEPLQLLALDAVRQALEDAGYPKGVIPDPELRKKTSVIIGVGGGAGPLGQRYAVRTALPAVEGKLSQTAAERLPEWTEDSFPGILLNVIAGRVANRFDLGGVNFTVDAACGSSLAAITLGVRDLEAGHSDMVIVGGVDSFQNPFDFVAFSKTRALSPRGRCRTFDASADGIAISEGLALVVLRRLEDAEAEGGRIYAVLRGAAGSSDGRDLSLTAPRAEGQQEALRRAYAHAGISPGTVGMVEAHGTGTVVGDRTEIQSLSVVFAEARVDRQFCGVGSVKSMIGHTKAAAGCAGMIKMALALHHHVQPPTLNVTEPNASANFAESPFYVQTEARPWLRLGETPLRAGASAFGFGGTNFHVVLEEYQGGYLPTHQEPFRRDWAEEIFLFSAKDAGALAQKLRDAAKGIGEAPEAIRLADVAASLAAGFDPAAPARAALVAGVGDRAGLASRLGQAADQLGSAAPKADGVPRRIDPRGSFLALGPALSREEVAFLFPGQGSQYPGMAGGIAMHFPAMRRTLEEASAWLSGRTPAPLGALIHPAPTLDEGEAKAQAKALTQTDVAQPAIGAVSLGVLRVLRDLGIDAGAMVGHSYGEYTALHAAGTFDAETLLHLAHARGDAIVQSVKDSGGDADLGAMSAISGSAAAVRAALGDDESVVLANMNAPDQTVIAGRTPAVAAAGGRLAAAGFNVQPLPVACGFHSECVAPARDRLAAALAAAAIGTPNRPVYGNSTAAPYPDAPEAVRAQLAAHLVMPVDFVNSVRAMHAAGARLFLEVGPGGVLSRLVDRCLDGEDGVLALASDGRGKAGIGPFLTLVAGAAAAGLGVKLDALWARRARSDLDVTGWDLAQALPKRPAVVWMVDPANVRPFGGKPARRGFATPIEEDVVETAPMPAPAAPALVASPLAAAASVAAPPAPASAAPAMPSAATSAEAKFALQRHQELMTRFLDASRDVMMAYLGQADGRAGAAGTGAAQPGVSALTVNPSQPAVAPVARTAAPIAPAPVAAPVTPAAVVPVTPAPAPAAPATSAVTETTVSEALRELIAERTGYPPEMLEADLDLEADLGIDSIKRVEIVGALRLQLLPQSEAGGEAVREAMGPVARARSIALITGKFLDVAATIAPAPVPAAPAAAPVAPVAAPPPSAPAAAALSEESVTEALRALIAERTGYPPEMLEADLDLEADLGIDSIKRVEIVGALRLRLLPQSEAGGEAVREAMGPVARARSIALMTEKFMEVASTIAPTPTPAAPAAAPVAAAAAASAPKAQGLTEAGVTEALRALIAERTGYPPEMLEADLDLEADLGIDSIKRVEIVGALRLQLLPQSEAGGEAVREAMGPVARARSIALISRKFLDVASSLTPTASVAAPAAQVEQPPMAGLQGWDQRYVMVAQPMDTTGAGSPLPTGRYLVSDDGAGLGDVLAKALRDRGCTVVQADPGLSDGDLRALIAAHQDWVGIFHLAAVAPVALDTSGGIVGWHEAVTRSSRALYTMLSAAGPSLLAQPGSVVVTASALGGAFGFDGTQPANPAAGGAPGLLKAVAIEWPGVHCRAVDLDPEMTSDERVEALLQEATLRQGPIEVGRQRDARLELLAQPRAFAENAPPLRQISKGDVVLVTGGARGITAKVVLHLAGQVAARFVLMGSAALPEAAEPADIAGLTEAPAVKAALIARAKAAGAAVRPAEIERQWREIQKIREIRATIDAIRALGAEADYIACDVRDAEAFAAAIAGVRARYGRLDGVLQGAGVIEDKLLADKTPESFERVIRTKTDSAETLARVLGLMPGSAGLPGEKPRFVIFFTSVAGRFGNRGQGDYGAANETVSKLARWLQAQPEAKGTRICAISWGPWDTGAGGMVSPEIKAQFDALGIVPIPPERGVAALAAEVQFGAADEPEVVWGEGPWARDAERLGDSAWNRAAE